LNSQLAYSALAQSLLTGFNTALDGLQIAQKVSADTQLAKRSLVRFCMVQNHTTFFLVSLIVKIRATRSYIWYK